MLTRRTRNLPLMSMDPMVDAMASLRNLSSTMESLFGDLWSERGRPTGLLASGVLPSINAWRDGDSFNIECSLPGVKKEDVEITLQDDILTVSGEIKGRSEVKDENWVARELHHGTFQRSVQLPFEVEEKDVKASFHDGILTITTKASQKARTRQVKVNIQ